MKRKISIILIMLGYAISASAQGTPIYQTGFEPPIFSPGTINGQDGWFAFGVPSSTVIETTTVETGVQAVGITPFGATFGVVGAGRSASYNAADQILTFSIGADFSATGTPSFWTVLDTQYNSSPPNIDFNIDQSGQIHIFIMGTDHPTGVSITRGVWNNYKLEVNFFNDTVSAFYNGATVLQGASFSSTGTTLGFYAFYAQGAFPGTDSGYFDNLSVTVSPATPAQMVAVLITTLQGMNITRQGTSLTDQLQQVENDLTANNGSACGDLRAFANHVSAQSGKALTTTQANQLLTAVGSIELALSCGP
jgi:hypothetical protein